MNIVYHCTHHQHDARLQRSTPHGSGLRVCSDVPLRLDAPVELQVIEHYLGDPERVRALRDIFDLSRFLRRVTRKDNGWSITNVELDKAIAEIEEKK